MVSGLPIWVVHGHGEKNFIALVAVSLLKIVRVQEFNNVSNLKNQKMYQVNIVKLTQDLASYIEKEAALTRKPHVQIFSEIGITGRTFREMKKRENGPQLRMDVFLLIVSWMGVEPGGYFIVEKPENFLAE